jgi:hypothetical protein
MAVARAAATPAVPVVLEVVPAEVVPAAPLVPAVEPVRAAAVRLVAERVEGVRPAAAPGLAARAAAARVELVAGSPLLALLAEMAPPVRYLIWPVLPAWGLPQAVANPAGRRTAQPPARRATERASVTGRGAAS